MKVHECAQYSPAWWNLRRGVPTASNGKRIFTADKAKPSTSSIDYACELAAELLHPGDYWTDQTDPKSQAMARGSFLEDEARNYLAMLRDEKIPEVGFATNDAGTLGCSPDGMYGSNKRGVEIKCPMMKTQIRYLIDGVLPMEYKPQVHMSMIVTGCESWDFVSYHQLIDPLIVTVERDSYTDAAEKLLNEFVEMYAGIRERIYAAIRKPEVDEDTYDTLF